MRERSIHWLPFHTCPDQRSHVAGPGLLMLGLGPNPQPRPLPWLGVEPACFHLRDAFPTNWAHCQGLIVFFFIRYWDFFWLFKCQESLECTWDIWVLCYVTLCHTTMKSLVLVSGSLSAMLRIRELFSDFEFFHRELLIFYHFCFSRVFMGFSIRRAQILDLEI